MARKQESNVRWEDGGLYFDCLECGGETHYTALAANVRCSHCGAIYELPLRLAVTKVAYTDQRGREIVNGH
jgi:LSD1 subclass zinc finger protein